VEKTVKQVSAEDEAMTTIRDVQAINSRKSKDE